LKGKAYDSKGDVSPPQYYTVVEWIV